MNKTTTVGNVVECRESSGNGESRITRTGGEFRQNAQVVNEMVVQNGENEIYII